MWGSARLGPSWNSGLEPRLRFATAYIIEARDAEGQPVYYTDKNADGRFEQELGRPAIGHGRALGR